jgi:hypothetical protein
MQVVLLRVVSDSSRAGIQGPLFRNETFEFMPIDEPHGNFKDTYGNTRGVHGRMLIDYPWLTCMIVFAATGLVGLAQTCPHY